MNAAPQPVPGRRTNILLPSHVFGMGARLNATSEGFGATARSWWANRLGLPQGRDYVAGHPHAIPDLLAMVHAADRS